MSNVFSYGALVIFSLETKYAEIMNTTPVEATGVFTVTRKLSILYHNYYSVM